VDVGVPDALRPHQTANGAEAAEIPSRPLLAPLNAQVLEFPHGLTEFCNTLIAKKIEGCVLTLEKSLRRSDAWEKAMQRAYADLSRLEPSRWLISNGLNCGRFRRSGDMWRVRRVFRPGGHSSQVSARARPKSPSTPRSESVRAAAELEALSSIKCFVDVVCHGPADFALRRHSSVARELCGELGDGVRKAA
jgi:hypothetical protein